MVETIKNFRSTDDNRSPFVSVIIPVYNDTDRLSKCLSALKYQTYPSQSFEVIVVDDASSEDITPLIEDYAHTRFFFQSQKGSYAARNKGISKMKGQIAAFIDSDCIPGHDWIEKAMAAWRTGAGDLIGGKINLMYRNPNKPTVAELYETFFSFQQKRNIQNGCAVTANLFVEKKVFNRIGPFCPDTKSGGDFEFTGRATRNGFKLVYDERVVVFHPARHELKELTKKKKRIINGFYSLREIEPVMANEFSAGRMLKHLLPPILSVKVVCTRKTSIRINIIDRLKVMFFIYYYKLIGFWYKLEMIWKH